MLPAAAAEIGQRYEEAMTRWEIGVRLEEPAEMEAARRLLAEMGARPDMRLTRKT